MNYLPQKICRGGVKFCDSRSAFDNDDDELCTEINRSIYVSAHNRTKNVFVIIQLLTTY